MKVLNLILRYDRPDVDGDKTAKFWWDTEAFGEPNQENLKKYVKEYGAIGGAISSEDFDTTSAGGETIVADTDWKDDKAKPDKSPAD